MFFRTFVGRGRQRDENPGIFSGREIGLLIQPGAIEKTKHTHASLYWARFQRTIIAVGLMNRRPRWSERREETTI